MDKTTEIRVYERGNGWPEVGDIHYQADKTYVIRRFNGPIHTDEPARGNYIWADAYVAGDLPWFVSEDELSEYRDEYYGICLVCGSWREETEPDARGYECFDCGCHAVMGIEDAVICGAVES